MPDQINLVPQCVIMYINAYKLFPYWRCFYSEINKKTIPAVIWVYGYGKGFMPTATEQQAQRGTYLKEFEPWPG